MMMPRASVVTLAAGSVMGRLLGAPSSERLSFHFMGGGADEGSARYFEAYFYRDNGRFYICNTCDDDNQTVLISCATNGLLLPRCILVPGSCEYDLTEFFAQCAQKQAVFLTLTASTLAAESLSGSAGMYLAVPAFARSLPVGGGFFRISDYFSVHIGGGFAAIDTFGRPLVKVLRLFVEGCASVAVENVAGGDGKAPFVVPLPCGFPEGTAVDLSLCCQIGGFRPFG